MTVDRLALAWVLVLVAFVVLLGVEFSRWTSLMVEGARVANERRRLTDEIQLREQQIVTEMRRHGALLQELQATVTGGDPAAFLTRLAELAQEKKMRIMAIGPLERQATPQFTKSWHTIQVQGPYRELRELAVRVEQEKGLLEDVRLEPAPVPPGSASATSSSTEEIQARMKMAALDLSAPAKQIIARAVAASGAPPPAGPPLALSVPTKGAQATTLGRDPFSFLTPPRPAPVATAEKTAAPLELRGIVAFPDGFLAIVNNQIVKVGDTVSGHRVERITENAVTVREPGAAPRTIQLPDLVHTAPAAPRR